MRIRGDITKEKDKKKNYEKKTIIKHDHGRKKKGSYKITNDDEINVREENHERSQFKFRKQSI